MSRPKKEVKKSEPQSHTHTNKQRYAHGEKSVFNQKNIVERPKKKPNSKSPQQQKFPEKEKSVRQMRVVVEKRKEKIATKQI